jgi:hypothetical protein
MSDSGVGFIKAEAVASLARMINKGEGLYTNNYSNR